MPKIFIDARGAKRVLPNEFAICASPEDVAALADAIGRAARSMEGYGWVHVRLGHPATSPSHTQPLLWEEGLPHRPADGPS